MQWLKILGHFCETVPMPWRYFGRFCIHPINQSVTGFRFMLAVKNGRTAAHLFTVKSLAGCMYKMSFARGIKHGIKQTKLRGKWSVSYGQYRVTHHAHFRTWQTNRLTDRPCRMHASTGIGNLYVGTNSFAGPLVEHGLPEQLVAVAHARCREHTTKFGKVWFSTVGATHGGWVFTSMLLFNCRNNGRFPFQLIILLVSRSHSARTGRHLIIGLSCTVHGCATKGRHHTLRKKKNRKKTKKWKVITEFAPYQAAMADPELAVRFMCLSLVFTATPKIISIARFPPLLLNSSIHPSIHLLLFTIVLHLSSLSSFIVPLFPHLLSSSIFSPSRGLSLLPPPHTAVAFTPFFPCLPSPLLPLLPTPHCLCRLRTPCS